MAENSNLEESSQEFPEHGKVQKVCKKWSEHEDGVLAYKLQNEEIDFHYGLNRFNRRTARDDLPVAKEFQSEEEKRHQEERMQQLTLLHQRSQEDEKIAQKVYQEILQEEESQKKRAELDDQEIARQMQEKEKRKYERYLEKQRERQLKREREKIEKRLAKQTEEARLSNTDGGSGGGGGGVEQVGNAMENLNIQNRSNIRVRSGGQIEDEGDFTDFYVLPEDVSCSERRILQERQDEELAKLLQEQEHKRTKAIVDPRKLREIETQDARLAEIIQEQEKIKARRTRGGRREKATSDIHPGKECQMSGDRIRPRSMAETRTTQSSPSSDTGPPNRAQHGSVITPPNSSNLVTPTSSSWSQDNESPQINPGSLRDSRPCPSSAHSREQKRHSVPSARSRARESRSNLSGHSRGQERHSVPSGQPRNPESSLASPSENPNPVHCDHRFNDKETNTVIPSSFLSDHDQLSGQVTEQELNSVPFNQSKELKKLPAASPVQSRDHTGHSRDQEPHPPPVDPYRNEGPRSLPHSSLTSDKTNSRDKNIHSVSSHQTSNHTPHCVSGQSRDPDQALHSVSEGPPREGKGNSVSPGQSRNPDHSRDHSPHSVSIGPLWEKKNNSVSSGQSRNPDHSKDHSPHSVSERPLRDKKSNSVSTGQSMDPDHLRDHSPHSVSVGPLWEKKCNSVSTGQSRDPDHLRDHSPHSVSEGPPRNKKCNSVSTGQSRDSDPLRDQSPHLVPVGNSVTTGQLRDPDQAVPQGPSREKKFNSISTGHSRDHLQHSVSLDQARDQMQHSSSFGYSRDPSHASCGHPRDQTHHSTSSGQSKDQKQHLVSPDHPGNEKKHSVFSGQSRDQIQFLSFDQARDQVPHLVSPGHSRDQMPHSLSCHSRDQSLHSPGHLRDQKPHLGSPGHSRDQMPHSLSCHSRDQSLHSPGHLRDQKPHLGSPGHSRDQMPHSLSSGHSRDQSLHSPGQPRDQIPHLVSPGHLRDQKQHSLSPGQPRSQKPQSLTPGHPRDQTQSSVSCGHSRDHIHHSVSSGQIWEKESNSSCQFYREQEPPPNSSSKESYGISVRIGHSMEPELHSLSSGRSRNQNPHKFSSEPYTVSVSHSKEQEPYMVSSSPYKEVRSHCISHSNTTGQLRNIEPNASIPPSSGQKRNDYRVCAPSNRWSHQEPISAPPSRRRDQVSNSVPSSRQRDQHYTSHSITHWRDHEPKPNPIIDFEPYFIKPPANLSKDPELHLINSVPIPKQEESIPINSALPRDPDTHLTPSPHFRKSSLPGPAKPARTSGPHFATQVKTTNTPNVHSHVAHITDNSSPASPGRHLNNPVSGGSSHPHSKRKDHLNDTEAEETTKWLTECPADLSPQLSGPARNSRLQEWDADILGQELTSSNRSSRVSAELRLPSPSPPGSYHSDDEPSSLSSGTPDFTPSRHQISNPISCTYNIATAIDPTYKRRQHEIEAVDETEPKIPLMLSRSLPVHADTELEWDPGLRGSLRRPKVVHWKHMATLRGGTLEEGSLDDEDGLSDGLVTIQGTQFQPVQGQRRSTTIERSKKLKKTGPKGNTCKQQ